MSNNCLVTKLKGVVDNDNLNKFGEVRMMVKLDSSGALSRTNTFFTSDTTPFEIRLLDNEVTFTDAIGDAQIIDSKHGVATGRYISGGNFLIVSGIEGDSWINIAVKSKYELGLLGVYVKDVQLSEVRYSTKIEKVLSGNAYPKYGTFKDLSRITSLNEIATWSNGDNVALKGNITDLGILTGLTAITLAKETKNSVNPVTGSWDNFITAQKSSGRTTCEGITIKNAKYCYVPFGSRSDIRVGGELESGILKWDASKMSIQFDSSLKVLTIGYTAEEAAAAFTGYEVIMCDPS